MHKPQTHHRAGIWGGLLLVSLLMAASGAAQAPTSAQEPVTPANRLPAASPEGAPLSLPVGQECPIDSQFNGSAGGWVSHSGAWYYNSEYLYTFGISGTSSSASYVADFADFDYQARMWRSGCDTCANRLIFRGTPDPLTPENNWYDEYKLQYTRDGMYSVWKRVAGGTAETIVPWAASAAINQGDAWNTARVVADGISLTFYINDTLLWSGTDPDLSSGRVGLGMYRSPTGTGDELRVDWARLCLLEYTIYLPQVMRQ